MCGVASVSSIRGLVLARLAVVTAGEHEMQGKVEAVGQRRRVPVRRPDFQFGVASRAQTDRQPLGRSAHDEAANRLGVASVQPLGQAHDRAQ
jgi:hypothetical protein